MRSNFLKEISKNKVRSIDQKLWKEFGIKHEKKHYQLFKINTKLISIDQELSEKERNKLTIDAIKKGYDLIYHAYLIDDNLRGEADFLIKTNIASDLGEYSYEIFDTKISKKPRPRHIYQITAYSSMLSKIQGKIPEKMYLIDGSDITHTYKPKEFLEFYNFTKSNFEKFLKKINNEKIYPEKCNHCDLCSYAMFVKISG